MKSSWLAYMLGGMTVIGIWTIATHKEILTDMKKCVSDAATQAVNMFKDMGNKKTNDSNTSSESTC